MAEQLITLKKDAITVVISTHGAELHSILKDGTEYLWDGNPDVWAAHAPVLFPICGGLKDNRYEYAGDSYTLPKHGYAKMSEFTLESATEESATFLLQSNAETKKSFPFDYDLRLIYTLKDNAVFVEYRVTNRTDGEMYFSIGGHEGYACPEGIEEYSLVFDQEEKRLTTHEVNGVLLTEKQIVLGENVKELPMKYDYFAVDALTLLYLESRGITLKHQKSGRGLRVDFEGFDTVFVWTKPGAKFLCIEPWCGLPDFEGSSFDFTEKRAINRLGVSETFSRTHVITPQ